MLIRAFIDKCSTVGYVLARLQYKIISSLQIPQGNKRKLKARILQSEISMHTSVSNSFQTAWDCMSCTYPRLWPSVGFTRLPLGNHLAKPPNISLPAWNHDAPANENCSAQSCAEKLLIIHEQIKALSTDTILGKILGKTAWCYKFCWACLTIIAGCVVVV